MRILSPLLPCKLTAENSQLEPISPVPVETARVARAAFPKRSTFMRIRDELGILYTDETFASLFPADGQPALARLSFGSHHDYAVRGRLDRKHAL